MQSVAIPDPSRWQIFKDTIKKYAAAELVILFSFVHDIIGLIKDASSIMSNVHSSGWVIDSIMDTIIKPPLYLRLTLLFLGLYMIFVISGKGPRKFATVWAKAIAGGILLLSIFISVQNTKPNGVTLSQLFKQDFANYFRDTQLESIKTASGIELEIASTLVLDFTSRSKFVAFYVPNSRDTYSVCAELLQRIDGVLGRKKRAEGGFLAERRLNSEQLIFTRRLYVYHEAPLLNADIETLENLYKASDMSVQFRSVHYVLMRNMRHTP